jgi:hypothetical protein
MARRPWWARLLISLAAAILASVPVALGLTILELYQAGHGMQPIGRPWLDVEQLGVHLSRADVVFLVVAVLGAGLAWRGAAAGGA